MKLKKVLITGASGALGSKVLDKFVASGASVIALDRSRNEKESHAGVNWITSDLSDSKALHSALSGLEVDSLIHCAGGFRFAKAEDTTDEDLEFLWNANLRSAFLLVRELLPGMKKRNFGRIVFVSARSTFNPGSGVGAYSASKAGLHMLVSSLAEEVKDWNINVNAVLPTIIDTPSNRSAMPQSDFSKWVKTEQLAEIIFSLTQPWGDPIHGALIPVSGRI